MNRHWNLREELYRIAHNWPSMVAAVLIGTLLGWGLSLIWPSHYRATSQVYIALNPYRKFEDTLFQAVANPRYSNLDNYHYWQMSQLEAAIYLDLFLQPTLDQLRAIDPYWGSVDLDQLRGMLDSEWRSTGTWSLMANHPESKRAQEAASAWSDVVIRMVADAVAAARRTFMIDQRLQAGENEMLQATLRLRDLKTAGKDLEEWQKATIQTDPERILEPGERWELLALITWPAQFTPSWMDVLERQPPADAPIQAYQGWVEQVKPLLETEASALQDRINFLDQKQIELGSNYVRASEDSLSFSPNIEVKRKEDQAPRPIRSSSAFVLIGGMIGILIWLLLQLVIISRSGRRQ
jgi:hypothetical protein